MKLIDVLHATTRPAWTLRLIVYIAVIVTVGLLVQVFSLW